MFDIIERALWFQIIVKLFMSIKVGRVFGTSIVWIYFYADVFLTAFDRGDM